MTSRHRRRAAVTAAMAAGGVALAAVTSAGAAQAAGRVVPGGYTLSVLAGNGHAGAPVAGKATSSPLQAANGVALDAAGDVFIASGTAVEKVTPQGTLSVVAGTGSQGTAVAGPATSSPLSSVQAVAVDSAGTLYLADNGRVEKVTAAGVLSILAGKATIGTPTPGPATSSALGATTGIAVDKAGNVYVADAGNDVVEKISPTGTLSVVAGTGKPATVVPGPATATSLQQVSALTIDGSGNLYVGLSSTDHQRTVGQVAKISATGTLSLVAGDPAAENPDAVQPGPATASGLGSVDGLALGADGDLFIADGEAGLVAKVDGVTSTISLIAGNPGLVDPVPGPALNSPVFSAGGLAVDATGAVYVGAATVSAGLLDKLTPVLPLDLTPAGQHRLGGSDRIATSVTASQALFPPQGAVTSVVVATSAGYADSLAGARLASAKHAPLLLSKGDGLDARTGAEIDRVLAAGGTIYLLGGEQALSPSLQTGAAHLSPSYKVVRLSGDRRFDPAAAIAGAVAPAATAPIYLTTGSDYPDGLAVSALAARTGGVVLLTDSARLPDATRAYLAAHDPSGARTIPVGGPAASAAATLPSAAATAAVAHKVVGTDRYATARLVAAQFAATSGATVTTAGLASGENWPDALVGAATMGDLSGPLLLTKAGSLSASAQAGLAAVNAKGTVTRAVIVGGTTALSDSTAAAFSAGLAGR